MMCSGLPPGNGKLHYLKQYGCVVSYLERCLLKFKNNFDYLIPSFLYIYILEPYDKQIFFRVADLTFVYDF